MTRSRDCAPPSELLGSIEAAEMFEVKPETFYAWRTRQHQTPFPEPWLILSGNPIWTRRALLAWGQATFRLDRAGRPTRKLNAHPPIVRGEA